MVTKRPVTKQKRSLNSGVYHVCGLSITAIRGRAHSAHADAGHDIQSDVTACDGGARGRRCGETPAPGREYIDYFGSKPCCWRKVLATDTTDWWSTATCLMSAICAAVVSFGASALS